MCFAIYIKVYSYLFAKSILVALVYNSQHYNRVGSSGSTGSDPIWHRITCVIIITSCGDDIFDDMSISCQYISKRVIVDGVEASRKLQDSSMGSSGLYGNSLGSPT